MRRFAVLVPTILIAGLLAFAAAPPAAAAKNPLGCGKRTLEGKSFRFCTGFVKSKDGTVLLDTDVTLPGKGAGPFPLIVMLHGLGGDKTSYEVDFDGDETSVDSIEGDGGSYRYNNAWFASRGYVVLNYTARGWWEDECLNADPQASDGDPELYPESPKCGIQLAHRKYEIKDTQYLIGKLVDGTLLRVDVAVDRKKVGVTGVSYGGGQTWMLTRDSVFKSPAGSKIAIAAAVPIIGWTDLLDAISPNGVVHENHMPPTDIEARKAEPTGVIKESYIRRFFTGMNIGSNRSYNLADYLYSWYETALEGEPYEGKVWNDAVHSFLANRSAYYMPQDKVVPTLAIEGWTDHIFPVIQAVQMATRLETESPGYPVKVILTDFGHPIAQNPADYVIYNAYAANEWLDHYVKGKGAAPTNGFESFETVCNEMGEQDASNYVAGSFDGLTGDVAVYDLGIEGTLDTDVIEQHANALDPFPIAPLAGCRDTDTLVSEGNLDGTEALPDGVRMLGIPTVTLTANPTNDNMYVAFRLWDVSADGETQALVDRGVFRLGGAGQQEIVAQLQGNTYDFGAGHSLKLELTANDQASFLAPAVDGTIEVFGVQLTLPQANPDAEAQG